jgi:hypothetical protein
MPAVSVRQRLAPTANSDDESIDHPRRAREAARIGTSHDAIGLPVHIGTVRVVTAVTPVSLDDAWHLGSCTLSVV